MVARRTVMEHYNLHLTSYFYTLTNATYTQVLGIGDVNIKCGHVFYVPEIKQQGAVLPAKSIPIRRKKK